MKRILIYLLFITQIYSQGNKNPDFKPWECSKATQDFATFGVEIEKAKMIDLENQTAFQNLIQDPKFKSIKESATYKKYLELFTKNNSLQDRNIYLSAKVKLCQDISQVNPSLECRQFLDDLAINRKELKLVTLELFNAILRLNEIIKAEFKDTFTHKVYQDFQNSHKKYNELRMLYDKVKQEKNIACEE